MAKHALPRRGSAAANALVTLDGAGGALTIDRWRTIIGWKGSRPQFDQNVVDCLIRAGLVSLAAGQIALSNAGRKFVGLKGLPISDEPPQLAGPRYQAPARPLNLAQHRPPQVRRPGSMDFRDHPSVMGGVRYDYRTGAASTDA